MVELDQFIEATLAKYPTLWSEFDPTWRSPCEVGEPLTQREIVATPWRPCRRSSCDDFSALENALKTTIHPSVKEYYGAYWSGCLEATAPQGHVSLILLWNLEDRDRLIENCIGHALTQRKRRAPLSVFFACTEPHSRLFLTINNDTGEVQLEKPAYKPLRTIARSLAEFLRLLIPAAPYLHPERTSLQFLYDTNQIK